MPDWKKIIDRAIAGRTIENFVRYRSERELEARGGSLKNPPVDVAIEALVEDFLLDERFCSIGVLDVDQICERLQTAIQPDQGPQSKLDLTNLCFDALVCIQELQARVTRTENRLSRVFSEHS